MAMILDRTLTSVRAWSSWDQMGNKRPSVARSSDEVRAAKMLLVELERRMRSELPPGLVLESGSSVDAILGIIDSLSPVDSEFLVCASLGRIGSLVSEPRGRRQRRVLRQNQSRLHTLERFVFDRFREIYRNADTIRLVSSGPPMPPKPPPAAHVCMSAGKPAEGNWRDLMAMIRRY